MPFLLLHPIPAIFSWIAVCVPSVWALVFLRGGLISDPAGRRGQSDARPSDFKPKVGGLDFLSDGRLVVSTWDPDGTVYLVSNLDAEDREAIQVKRIAAGLAEPLGLTVVNDEIYVLQKHELTRLIDHDGDDVIDEYQTVCNSWQASANFHEFAFGLVYEDGYFYAALATAINPGGASTQPQIPDRGKVIKIAKDDGSFEFVAHGLRTPNGIGFGADGELFIADNQGDWLPASKIVHVQPGAWYGSRSVDFEGTEGLEETPPVVWLPQDEIGNSPTQPAPLDVGPYQGQMIHGEVTHGGLKRVFGSHALVCPCALGERVARVLRLYAGHPAQYGYPSHHPR